MGEKDITERHLMEHTDIFAEIYNKIVRWQNPNLPEIRDSELKYVPVHTFRETSCGVRELERDIYMKWCPAWAPEGALLIGNENQTKEERWTIGRLPGYAAGNLMRTLEDNGIPLPETGVILYLGDREWKGPKTLKELYGNRLSSLVPDLIGNDRVTVVDVGALPETVIDSLKTDFREVARLVRSRRLKIPYNAGKGRLRYFMATARVLAAIAGIGLTESLLKKLKDVKEEDQTMDMMFSFLSRDEAQKARNAIRQSRKTGRSQGKAEERADIRKVMAYLEEKGQISQLSSVLASDRQLDALLEEIRRKESC